MHLVKILILLKLHAKQNHLNIKYILSIKNLKQILKLKTKDTPKNKKVMVLVFYILGSKMLF